MSLVTDGLFRHNAQLLSSNTVSRSPFVAAVASAKSPKQAMAGQTHALSRAELAVAAAVVQIPLDRWGQCASKGANCN